MKIFYKISLCLCVSLCAHCEVRLQNFYKEVSLVEDCKFLAFIDVIAGYFWGGRYRGPAGRLDTLYVLSERGRGKVL
jgi:Fe-S oxidoreductase